MEVNMQAWTQKLKYGFKNGAYLGLGMFLIVVGSGCASTHKTTKTETATTVTKSTDAVVNDAGEKTVTTVSTTGDPQNKTVTTVSTTGDPQNKSVVSTSQATTATTETKPGHPGLISSTVHAIGWVIALPFRLIGGLIGWIF
jgi:phage tail sheath gpL-like